MLFLDESDLLKVFNRLNENDIYPRRYFYPALNTLSFTSMYPADTPFAQDIASRILCLPLYHDITEDEQELIVGIMVNCLINE